MNSIINKLKNWKDSRLLYSLFLPYIFEVFLTVVIAIGFLLFSLIVWDFPSFNGETNWLLGVRAVIVTNAVISFFIYSESCKSEND